MDEYIGFVQQHDAWAKADAAGQQLTGCGHATWAKGLDPVDPDVLMLLAGAQKRLRAELRGQVGRACQVGGRGRAAEALRAKPLLGRKGREGGHRRG